MNNIFNKEHIQNDDNLKKSQPKKKTLIILVSVLAFILLFSLITICVVQSAKNNSTQTDAMVTISQFTNTARQQAINECCNYSDVSKVDIEFATFNTYTEDGMWIAEMAGHFYPIDRYGEFGLRHIFDITVEASEGTLYPLIVDPEISKKKY